MTAPDTRFSVLAEPALRAEGLAFSYGSRVVIPCLTFTLNSAEFVGIIGPNGAGKSTLIKCLSRLLRPKSGRVLLRGAADLCDLAHMDRSKLARLLAVVPQNPSLPETFTAAEIILMGRTPHLGLLQKESPRDLAIVWWAMGLTDTQSLAGRRIGELSGGERQRVVIARALAQEPRVLLLDEPTTHLDLTHQLALLDLVRRLHHECGLAVLAVFHDLNLAAQYCDRLLLLEAGAIVAEGTPAQVISTANIARVYGAQVSVLPHPINGLPLTVMVPAAYNGHHNASNGSCPTALGCELVHDYRPGGKP